MYRVSLISALISIGVECSTYYPRYSDTTRYPSSTIANLNNNFPYKTASYGSDIASFPEVTRYPNYSPGYGYSTNSYSGGYSTTRYPNSNYNSEYSSTGYNTLYGGGSSNVNYNQGLNRYGAGYGTGYTAGSYGTGSGYGTGTGYGVGTGYGSGTGYGIGTGYGSSSGYGVGTGYNSGYNTGYGTGSTGGGYSSYEAPFMRNIGGCVNRGPQTGIWVDSLMGMWYGVEYIQHLGADSRIDYTKTCIVIHIAEPMDRPSTENQLFHVQHINAKFRQEYRHLRLLWDEAGHTTEYALYFRNDTAGYWHVFDGQNGTLANMPKYQQFSGTVQVLKAVNDHLVLNFCQEGGLNGRSAQLYSVLFSRKPGDLNQWEIDSVHSMLQNKKLSTASRRMVCGNSAERALYSFTLSLFTCLLAYVVGPS